MQSASCTPQKLAREDGKYHPNIKLGFHKSELLIKAERKYYMRITANCSRHKTETGQKPSLGKFRL